MPEHEPRLERSFRASIAAKLYCFGFLALLAVASLSIASI
jgi:hypothetical protein